MPGASSPRQEKERFLRHHIDQQATRGGSVRAYCLEHGVSRPRSFGGGESSENVTWHE